MTLDSLQQRAHDRRNQASIRKILRINGWGRHVFWLSGNRDPLGYYAALGVDPSASIDRIKKAFKAKAQELHPDRNRSPHATEHFQFLTEAYRVLSDAHCRSRYDASVFPPAEKAEQTDRAAHYQARPFSFKVPMLAASFIAIVLVALLIASVIPGRTADKRTGPSEFVELSADQTPDGLPESDAIFGEPIWPLPRTGQIGITRQRAHAEMAPLKIVTFSRSPNYYVKLVDWATHAPAISFFIRSGETLSAEVPLGEYEIRCASGNLWHGEKYLFGPDASYSKADEPLVFEREGGLVAGYTIDLSKHPTGNLEELQISSFQF